MPSAPLIAVSPNATSAGECATYRGKPLEYGEAALVSALRAAGGAPVLALRAGAEREEALAELAAGLMERADGLLLSGGDDLAPQTFGAAPDARWPGEPLRDRLELALYRAARARALPVLAICRGAQLINAAEGGSLWLDLPTLRPSPVAHRDEARYDEHGHGLTLRGRGPLARLLTLAFEGEERWVNSVHHQGLRRLGAGLEVLATAPDGLVEAFTLPGSSWLLAVQWHPEWMQARASQRALFAAFVDRCRR